MQSLSLKRIARVGGYTLIELAIVMVVVGVLIVTGADAYNIYVKQTALNTTNLNVKTIATALSDFKAANTRYPCPAPANLPRTDPRYGHQQCGVTPAPGVCDPDTGICGQAGMRAITWPGQAVAANPPVYVGSVPFRELNLPENIMLDGYNARLAYAVTGPMTSSATFSAQGGGIAIVDASAASKSVLAKPGSADFVVMSFGPDRAGAHLSNGQVSVPCPGLATKEGLNCAAGVNAVYRNDVKSTSNDANQLDDIMSFYSHGDDVPWQMTTAGNTDIFNRNVSVSKIGILTNQADTLDDIKADVSGNARARDKLITTNALDVSDSAIYTTADLIGGDLHPVGPATPGGADCPNPNEFLVGFANNAPICRAAEFDCEGYPITAINPDGSIECQSFSCPAQNVTICSEVKTLPASKNKKVVTLTAGDSRVVKFLCNKGTWQSQSSSGQCVCTPKTTTETVPCGTGMTGTRKVKRTTTCPSGSADILVELSNTCRCVGANQTQDFDCPPGQEGAITKRRTFTCTSSTSGTWSGWTVIRNTCQACSAQTRTRTIACPSGQSGHIVQTSTQNCSTGIWGAWTETSNTCACDASATDTRIVNCPKGQTGEIDQIRYATCPSGWGPWTTTSNTCVNNPSASCRWVSHGGGIPGSVHAPNLQNSRCTCGSTGTCYQFLGGRNYMNYNGCTCD